MTRQTERTEQKHAEQMKQAERRNKQMQEERRSDLHGVKTKFERHQRQQMREHEDTVRDLASELRHAKAAAKTKATAPE